MKNNLPFYTTYRSLGSKVYRIKLYFIRLTDEDLFLVFLTASILWAFIDRTGIAKKPFLFGFHYDPWLWLGGGIIMALALSFANKLRPDDSIQIFIRGFFAPKLYSPRNKTGDKFWKPSNKKLSIKLFKSKRS